MHGIERGHNMGNWNDFSGADSHGPSGDKQDAPPEPRYLGLTGTQFNLAVFTIVGAIALAVGLIFLGGAGAVQDFFGGDNEVSSQSAAVVRTVTPTATEAPSTPTAAPTPAGDVDQGAGDDSAAAVDEVLNTFDPFSLMGALGSSGSAPAVDITGPGGAPSVPADQVDDSLKAILLREGDLPPGFQSFGEMAFSVPTDVGTADMVASMFTTGDLSSGDFGTMVMSAVIAGPGVTAEIGDLDQVGQITQADLDEAATAMEEFGITLTELNVLDASGLGDAGMGMHMVMDFSGMYDSLGLPADESVPDGIAWDMYVFVRGDRMLMVMVMWPSDGAAGADARTLADIMDGRAAAS
jgi:hypothetical protein